MPVQSDFNRAAHIFKVLAHPNRLKIVCAMMDHVTINQKQLVENLGWPQSTVNRHLSALRDAGLVVAHRNGTTVDMGLKGPVTNALMHAVCDWVHPETGERMSGSLRELLASHSVATE